MSQASRSPLIFAGQIANCRKLVRPARRTLFGSETKAKGYAWVKIVASKQATVMPGMCSVDWPGVIHALLAGFLHPTASMQMR